MYEENSLTPPASTWSANLAQTHASQRQRAEHSWTQVRSVSGGHQPPGGGCFVTQQETSDTPSLTLCSCQPCGSRAPQTPKNVIHQQRKMRLQMKCFPSRFYSLNSSIFFLPQWMVQFLTSINFLWGHFIPSGTSFQVCAGHPFPPAPSCIFSAGTATLQYVVHCFFTASAADDYLPPTPPGFCNDQLVCIVIRSYDNLGFFQVTVLLKTKKYSIQPTTTHLPHSP